MKNKNIEGAKICLPRYFIGVSYRLLVAPVRSTPVSVNTVTLSQGTVTLSQGKHGMTLHNVSHVMRRLAINNAES